jgi:hypothetical protein
MATGPPLSIATGYCVVCPQMQQLTYLIILLGLSFAVGMIFTTHALKKYRGEIIT